MGHGRHQIGPRNNHRQRHEMRRKKNDLAPDLLACQESFEQLLATSFCANDDVLKCEKMLQRKPAAAERMIGAQQTAKVMSKQSLLKEIAFFEVGEVTHGQIDFT